MAPRSLFFSFQFTQFPRCCWLRLSRRCLSGYG